MNGSRVPHPVTPLPKISESLGGDVNAVVAMAIGRCAKARSPGLNRPSVRRICPRARLGQAESEYRRERGAEYSVRNILAKRLRSDADGNPPGEAAEPAGNGHQLALPLKGRSRVL